MWFLTYTGGICSCFRFLPMPLTFIYPSDKHKGLHPARCWVRCAKVKWSENHLEYSFEFRCSTVKPPERDFVEEEFFYFLFFIPLNNFCIFPPFCFAVLAGLFPFILFSATQRGFPQVCTCAGGQCWVGAWRTRVLPVPWPKTLFAGMETACWAQGQGHWEQSCLDWWEGLGHGASALRQFWWEESNAGVCLKRKAWHICRERQKILKQRKCRLQNP